MGKTIYVAILLAAAAFIRGSLYDKVFGPLRPKSVQAAASSSQPAAFPADIPIPPEARDVTKSTVGALQQAGFTIGKPATEMLQYYQSSLSAWGWQLSPLPADDKEEGADGFAGAKAGRRLGVMLEPDPSNASATHVSIVVYR